MMQIAFYKGTKTGVAGVYNRGVRWIEAGKYSHCEIIFSNGVSASSSYMDGGVRFKGIVYDPERWDVLDIPWANEKQAMAYFIQKIGRPYNLRGNLHFILGFVRGDSYGEFCSECCAGALGFENPWQFAPNQLYNVVKLINERYYSMLEVNKLLNVSPVEEEPVEDTGSGEPPKKPPTNP